MKSILPSERIRKGTGALLKEGATGDSPGRILQEGMRLILQELYEAEATEFLERGHYERNGERLPGIP